MGFEYFTSGFKLLNTLTAIGKICQPTFKKGLAFTEKGRKRERKRKMFIRQKLSLKCQLVDRCTVKSHIFYNNHVCMKKT